MFSLNILISTFIVIKQSDITILTSLYGVFHNHDQHQNENHLCYLICKTRKSISSFCKEDFDVVWALQSENYIAFQIRFCFKNGNCNLFLQINNDYNNSVCFHEDHDLLLSFIRTLHAISMLGYHNTLKSLTSPWFDCCLLVCLSKFNFIVVFNCI